MAILSKSEIIQRLDSIEDSLVISPILDDAQLNAVSVDLRVGTEFKVLVNSRNLRYGVTDEELNSFYQVTYRDFGEELIIYPNQQVLADTYEYIRMPNDCFGQLFTRSSIHRIGLSVATIVQPGYRGTLTISLENSGSIPIILKSGMRMFQLVIHQLNSPKSHPAYLDEIGSKYIGGTSPVVSSIYADEDLIKLVNMKKIPH